MIIGVAGRIGAGKEALTNFFREKGFEYFETSQIIIEELKKIGKEVNREGMQDWGDEQRKAHGPGALMKIMLERTKKSPEKDYIFDSLRNSKEVDFMRQNVKDFFLIGVDANPKIRFERILKRGKESDPKTWEGFLKMDERDNFDKDNEFGQQTGKCIGMADFIVVNDDDLESSMKQIKEIYEKII